MKRLLLTFLMVFMVSVAVADEIQVPLSCWPKDLQQEFLAKGIKLDLRSEERTTESWGFVVNEGNSFKIFTYRSAQKEDFKIIQEIVFKIEAEKNK